MANLDQLKQFIENMAAEHKSAVYNRNGRSRIRVPSLEEDNQVLIQAYKSTNEEVKSKGNIIPAAEWLLDNYYVIEEQFKEIQYTVNKNFYNRLPVLVEGRYSSYPRIYGIAAGMVEHLDGLIDEESLIGFIKFYQEQIHLTSKELWVFPIMLRICLLERIKDIALYISDTIQLRKQADKWALKLIQSLAATREEPKSKDDFHKAIQDHEAQVGIMKPAYAERLLHRLREEGGDAAPIIRWVDGKLAVHRSSADDIVHEEHQKQARYQNSMGNAITSLRLVNGLKWEEIFEELSLLNQILNQDPADIYALMDFSSRDNYRKKVEALSQKYGIDEIKIAVKAIECARQNKENVMEKYNHVGYYIVDNGLGQLVDKLGGRRKSSGRSLSSILYFGSIVFLTLVFWFAFLASVWTTSEILGLGGLILSAAISFLPIWSIAIGIVHWAVTRIYKPHHIPKLELKEGIPEQYRTIVAIPTLLTDEKRVIELVEQMEVFYLANQEENIHFALVGDYKDGPEEHTDKDSIIIETGTRLIKELNQRYGREDIFFFFHRYRQWNAKQGSWMGWERKRGALTEFNALLSGDKNTSYSTQIGDLSVLGKIKYVITLDADTQLPRDNAKRLIGAMAHPLNTPVLNQEGTRVVEGYGLMQPRIGISVDSASRSFFSLTFSGQTGVDPYTTAVSDVYQDLFHEGIFTGKGIYQPEVFEKVLKDAIPENSVLSHDLLEGSYVRTGLVSDIELIDGYPSHYIGYSLRLHRWVRGDWQLLPWLFPRVRNRNGHNVVNPINRVSKWKMLDNMRRSLLSPALFLAIVLSFIVLPGSTVLWLCLSMLTLLLPLVTDLIGKLVSVSSTRKDNGVGFSSLSEGTRNILIQIVLSFVFLAHQAYLMIDAVIRSVWRVTVSHKNMLEWVTAVDSDRKFKGEHADYWHKMKESVLISGLFCLITFVIRPEVGYLSLIAAIAWSMSPYVAWQIGKPKDKRIPMLSQEQILKIRKTARKTWKYFDDLVKESENWLPPDNYQEDPPVGVAHRTSPTNIGLHLMSVLSARDLGYISTLGTVVRIENTINTLKKMEKWKGHFYNWYDTISLVPLKPLYISTVDNGNLVGYLITLLEGLDGLVKRPLIGKENILGLQDILVADENKDNPENHSLLNMMVHSEEVSGTEWQMLLDDLKGFDDELDSLINEYENEASMLIPWVKLLQKVPAPLMNEKGAYKEAAKKLSELLQKLNGPISIQYLYDNYLEILKGLSETLSSLSRDARKSTGYAEAKSWLKQLELSLGESYSTIKKFYARKQKLLREMEVLIRDMDFRLLYDEKKDLFAIGYNAEDDELSKVYYDLLASEARQASFIAIAKGDVPQKHWFKMGRGLSLVGDRRALISWSGTMFEYFMPLLIMKDYDNTLLNETYTAVVRGQKHYGEQHRLPWGVSESGFYAFDLHLNYQYKAFGIPHLGLKRGLVNDRVVTPYASLLALTVEPALVYKNLEALKAEGLTGTYGFYEAIDYTSERMPKKQKSMIVKSFMAHHQGMILVAINNYLNDNIMRTRFHSVPMVKATELLLQERMPRREIYIKEFEEIDNQELDEGRLHQEIKARRTFTSPTSSPIPEISLLSNGNYTVMLTDSGGGFSKFMGQSVTRWREDPTGGDWGMLFYITNLNSNNYWSATHLPVGGEPGDYKVVFEPDHAAFSRRDGNIETKTEVVVSPEFNGEVRSISLTNHSNSGRMMEVTSYFEVVLCPYAADLAHPAFTNLFIRTEHVPEWNTILANRRPRKSDEKQMWLFHTLTTDGEVVGSVQFETDRSKFIGRGRSLQNPQVMDPEFPLTNTTGAVLDPIVSMRVRVFIPAGETARVSYMTGVADSREAAISLARDCQGSNMPNRALELAWTHSQVELRYLNITAGQANLFQAMASQIIYNRPLEEWKQELLRNNHKGQSALWSYGISGDLPIIVLQLDKMEHIEIAKQMLTAHEYFRLQGLQVDLVLLNSYGNSYEQPVQDRLHEMTAISHARDLVDMPGGVFIRQSSNIPPEDLNLLYSVARIVLNAERGSIANQMEMVADTWQAPVLETEEVAYAAVAEFEIQAPDNLLYQNSLGGFRSNGEEYIIFLKKNELTPLPWSNIIANEKFGFLVTESGSGYTWCKNSQANKLTPWSNDPVQDTTGEALYIRDDLTGEYWTSTPLLKRNDSSYLIRHGHGYSIFQNLQYGIETQQTMFIPVDDTIKLTKLSLKNHSQAPRKLSLFFYIEWVLGVNRENSARFIVTEYDEANNGMMAYNRYNDGFSELVAFMGSSAPIDSYTNQRYEFIGRNGTMNAPAAMAAKHFSNHTEVNHDPCSAIQVKVELAPGESKDVLFLLGQGKNVEEAKKLMLDYKSLAKAEEALQEAKQFWSNKLGVLQIKTPDTSMDLMLNKWLIYQTYACRLLARTGFYQAGGAYGFRDQLQDVMALVYSEPTKTKEQILLAAEHQFLEGDVQHWWHPPHRGVRTRITDDLLFLPYVTADYIERTGDWGVLDELVNYIEDDPLKPDEHDRFSVPRVSEEKGSIYDHCIRSIEKAMNFGSRGLPLMGGGDWNDGMDKVGIKGKGESVWLGWFLYTVLQRFIPVCRSKEDNERANRYEQTAKELVSAIEKHAWDGAWYRRAFFDDGTPLGSEINEECRIDSISQSWAVISGGAREERAKAALQAVQNHLVNEDAGLIKLLSPPFDTSSLEPGYIKGYVPGVRENGGQYTHAAVWTVMANARLGKGNQAWNLYQMINPINHTRTRLDINTYKGEPYVMAADVYAIPPHTGRGGWTWYTGSSGWMYRVGIGEILGFRKDGDRLYINPCIPEDWPGFSIEYRFGNSKYNIEVQNPDKIQKGVRKMLLDGSEMQEKVISLKDDGNEHKVTVMMGVTE